MKKKLLIVSSDDIILYQPTILNLYNFLEEVFDVTILTFEPEYLGKAREEEKKIIYIKPVPFTKRLYRIPELLLNAVAKRVDRHLVRFSYRVSFTRIYKEKLLRKILAKLNADIFIAVDPMPLYAVQQVKGRSHFLSLEIIPGDFYWKKIKDELIASVIVQNKMRFEFLFGRKKLPVFYIQNSPMLKDKVVNTGLRNDLLWAGTVVQSFAVLNCFEFIKAYPQYNLQCKGGVEQKTKLVIEKKYADLLQQKKVIINSSYLPASLFVQYLSGFKIGFCFYSHLLIKSNFNYETAPSGKLFMYLAAGVPVIASNISGFAFIKEYGAGILVNDYLPDTLFKAVQEIENNYYTFSAGAYRAFDENCFDKNAFAYRSFLQEEENTG